MTEQDQQARATGTAADAAEAAVPAPRGPVPDLGFFAGPAPAPAPGGFGGPAPLAGLPAPVGQPVAPGAFGGFAPGPAPAPAPTATATSKGLRIVRRLVVGLAVLAVLGFFGLGRFGGLAGFLAGDMSVPATLQGVPRATDPEAVSTEHQLESALEGRNSGDAVVAVYGTPSAAGTAAPTLFFIGQRARADVDRELSDGGVASGATRSIGENSCGTAPDGLSICVHTSRSTTVIVGGNLPVEQVALATDEAWAAQ